MVRRRPADVKTSLVLLDATPDGTPHQLELVLDAVFNVVPVHLLGSEGRTWFSIATTGGTITVDIDKGVLVGNTGSVTIKPKYVNKLERIQQSTVTLSASSGATAKSGSPKQGLSAVLKAGEKRTHECTFEDVERILSPIKYSDRGVRWELASTRGEKAVSDYIARNLYLSLNIAWEGMRAQGTATLVPDEVAVFRVKDKRKLIPLKSALIYGYALVRRNRLRNHNGVTVGFSAQLKAMK